MTVEPATVAPPVDWSV